MKLKNKEKNNYLGYTIDELLLERVRKQNKGEDLTTIDNALRFFSFRR